MGKYPTVPPRDFNHIKILFSDMAAPGPICPELVQNKDDVRILLGRLSKTEMTELLEKELRERKVFTVGQLASLSSQEVNSLQEIRRWRSAEATVLDALKVEFTQILGIHKLN